MATKEIEASNQPNTSISFPSLHLAFDQELITSDLTDEVVEIMTMKNTSQFRFIHDKNSGPLRLKTKYGSWNGLFQ